MSLSLCARKEAGTFVLFSTQAGESSEPYKFLLPFELRGWPNPLSRSRKRKDLRCQRALEAAWELLAGRHDNVELWG